MLELTDINVIKKICKDYGFQFKKGLGQNFLCDLDTVLGIIEKSGITKDTSVIEIGPGFGSLTSHLLEYAKKVTALEIDESLIPVLSDLFKNYDNFNLINEDVLKFDLSKITDDNTKVVANLPYYITSPVLTYLVESRLPFKSITVMVQKEVAKRMTAKPNTKDYGALTLLLDYYTKSEIILDVPKELFIPSPKVDSAVVKMDILKEPKVKVKNEKLFFKVIRASFNQRRKTLLNGLSNSGFFNKSKEEIEEIITSLGYDSRIRGEALSIEDFAKISDLLS